MIRWSRKVWIGMGAATLAGTSLPGSAPAQHGTQHTSKPPAAKEQGTLVPPVGGEAYLTDGGPRDTRIRIYRDIALMRGHLLIGDELIAQGQWDEALPHFLHPTEELYGLMERYITLHKVTPFKAQLLAQSQAVKAKNKAAYQQAAKVVDQRLGNALASFKRFMTSRPFTAFTAETMVEVVKVAKAEYEAAIEDGRFAKPVEYQDGRGFVWHAEKVIAQHEAEFAKADAAALAEMRRALAALKAAWPAALAPERPVMDAATLGRHIDAFEAAAKRFY